MVLVIIGIIVYTFRDSAGPILEQLEKTTPAVIAGICAMTVVYHCVEGVITTLLAKQYNREFTLGMGITNAFLCSFYRVATLGSGAGVAAIVYLGEHGIEYSKSFGMYMLQYAFHKISIAFFSMILFTLNWNYMRVHFGEYMWLLLAGYLITLIITVVLILFSCSRQFHRMLLWVVDFFNGKTKGRFDPQAAMLHDQCQMLEDASRQLMGEKRLVAGAVGLNLIKFAFWYSIPYLIFLGQGRLRSRRRWRSHRFLSCLRQSFRHRRESALPSSSLLHSFPELSEPDWQAPRRFCTASVPSYSRFWWGRLWSSYAASTSKKRDKPDYSASCDMRLVHRAENRLAVIR